MPKILSSDIALNDQKQRSLVLICNYPFVWSWLDSRYNSLNLSSGTAYTYMIAIDDMYGHSIAFRIMVKVFIPIARGLFSSYCIVSRFNIKFISQVVPSCTWYYMRVYVFITRLIIRMSMRGKFQCCVQLCSCSTVLYLLVIYSPTNSVWLDIWSSLYTMSVSWKYYFYTGKLPNIYRTHHVPNTNTSTWLTAVVITSIYKM